MLKLTKLSILAVLTLAMLASVPAMAYRGHHHHRSSVSVGFVFGSPWYYGYPGYAYYPPAYYYPPVSYSSPPVYVERGDAYTPSEQASGYWYFCPEAKAYYPYVKQCAAGWQKVSPQPQQ